MADNNNHPRPTRLIADGNNLILEIADPNTKTVLARMSFHRTEIQELVRAMQGWLAHERVPE